MEQLINDILKKREEELPKIEEQITNLRQILDNLEEYKNLRNDIVDSEGCLKADGKFAHLIAHPNVVASIYNADSTELESAIKQQIEKLERLKLRFSRKSLTIQIFGGAGSGKSTFIQSITSLDNNVVMAAEGDHCTGTTSYIRNVRTGFETRIYPYTRLELLNIFNENLNNALNGKNLPSTHINSFDEINNFDLESVGLNEEDYSVSHYVNNYQTITDVLNTRSERDPENNRDYIRITNPIDVQQYVAHHNDVEDTQDPNYRTYTNYLAVKFVRVFTPFRNEKAGKIELLDSVGFGDPATSLLVEKGMYQSIADNCDIVVILCCPFKRSEIADAAAIMDKARYVDKNGGIERISERALFLVLNNDRRETKNNTHICDYSKSAWTNGRNPHVDSPFHRTETILCADLHDPQDTEQNVLVPMLQQVADSLPQIDANLKQEVNEQILELQQQYNTFVQSISSVLIGRTRGAGHNDFNQRFKAIYEYDLRNNLKEIVEDAKCGINRPAASLRHTLQVKCNGESVARYIDELASDIDGINPYSTPAEWLGAYEKLASKLAHSVPLRFKDIDVDLNKNVEESKAKVFNSLYTNGRLNVVLKKGDISPIDYENTLEWAAKLNDLIITEAEYPTLHNMINDLLNFKISIDGLLLFRIVKHFDELLDGGNAPDQNRLYKDKYQAMRFYLQRNLDKAFDKIKPELESFTVAPNEAIYYAVDSFIYNLLYHPKVEEECRILYEQFEKQIWREELESIQAQVVALDEWKNMRDKLSQKSIKTI